MSRASLRPLSILGVLCVSACAFNQTGQLYEMKTGRASRMSVYDADYASGEIHGALPDGSRCNGSFGSVTTENARKMTAPDILFSDNADASIAVLRCARGAILRCALAARPRMGFSYGACTDQRGSEYLFLF